MDTTMIDAPRRDDRQRSELCFRDDLCPSPGEVYRLPMTGITRRVVGSSRYRGRWEVEMEVMDGRCKGRRLMLTLTEFLCYKHVAEFLTIVPTVQNGISSNGVRR